jgi:hypothetical protein
VEQVSHQEVDQDIEVEEDTFLHKRVSQEEEDLEAQLLGQGGIPLLEKERFRPDLQGIEIGRGIRNGMSEVR